jgi:CheY-like chemotaxis protein
MDTLVPSVLIIDDDSRNIFALRLILKAKGYSCLTAAGVQSGIQLLRENRHIGIILMDMMMPGTDGYEAMALLKKDTALGHLPVVAVTAQAMPGDREKCIAAGADAYVSKPVNVELMLSILERYL